MDTVKVKTPSQETRVGTMVATAREILSKQILLVALKDFLMRTFRDLIMSIVLRKRYYFRSSS